jgi:hypothetical protein
MLAGSLAARPAMAPICRRARDEAGRKAGDGQPEAGAERPCRDLPACPKPMAAFVNHYDENSNKCFMAIQDMEAGGWDRRWVVDAFEGINYASYEWHPDKVKKFWEVPPVSCSVKTLAGDEIQCHSDDEFDELIHRNFGVTLK